MTLAEILMQALQPPGPAFAQGLLPPTPPQQPQPQTPYGANIGPDSGMAIANMLRGMGSPQPAFAPGVGPSPTFAPGVGPSPTFAPGMAPPQRR